MAPRPKPQAALTKAPTREHPVVPDVAPAPAPAPPLVAAAAPAQDDTVMFSARVARSLRTRVRRYAVDADLSVQAVTEAALREYLDNRQAK